jgi:NitT/TauT family transport system ATP-binding protein
MITINVAKKSFQDTLVIRDLSLSLSRGEIVALIGPSGAGKSTLLNIIAGLDTDFSGDIQLHSNQASPPRVSLMFQQARLMPWLTVEENVALVAKTKQGKASEVTPRQWLEKVGLGDWLGAYPSQLSGGMMKRVALARAFMFSPDILLMDEPFSSIDQPSAQKLRDTMMTLWHQTKPTIIYVTHDLQEAINVADKVILLSASPMQMQASKTIDIPRPRSFYCPQAIQINESLTSQFPQLLRCNETNP